MQMCKCIRRNTRNIMATDINEGGDSSQSINSLLGIGMIDENYFFKKEPGKTQWTPHSVSRLICVYKQLTAKEKEKDVRLWEYIQSEMDNSGYLFTISACKMKWRKLLKTYHENKGKKSTWTHFKEMDEIYKKNDASKANKNKITFYFKTKKTTPASQ